MKEKSLAVGRITTVITGETRRIHAPALRSFELLNRQTLRRFRVEIASDDQKFIVAPAPGEYELV